ncbi:type IV pilus modification protein PilV, partial [Ralstonia solanacearum]
MRRALPGKALGFTMLEALIAVLIVAVGVLSVANLLLKSYRFTQQASYDAMGQLLAANMADRIRVNSG